MSAEMSAKMGAEMSAGISAEMLACKVLAQRGQRTAKLRRKNNY